jgi:hypothetical protein
MILVVAEAWKLERRSLPPALGALIPRQLSHLEYLTSLPLILLLLFLLLVYQVSANRRKGLNWTYCTEGQ